MPKKFKKNKIFLNKIVFVEIFVQETIVYFILFHIFWHVYLFIYRIHKYKIYFWQNILFFLCLFLYWCISFIFYHFLFFLCKLWLLSIKNIERCFIIKLICKFILIICFFFFFLLLLLHLLNFMNDLILKYIFFQIYQNFSFHHILEYFGNYKYQFILSS